MSYKLKKNRLDEISDILSNRCTANSELYFVLMKEKEKLENQLSTNKSHNHEIRSDHSKPRGDKEAYQVKVSSDNTISTGKQHNSVSNKRINHKTPSKKQKTKQKKEAKLHTQNEKEFINSHHQRKVQKFNEVDSIKPSQKFRTDKGSTKKIAFSTIGDKAVDVPEKHAADHHQQSDKTANIHSSNGSNMIKTFTEEEIHQMSTHNKKKIPNYINPPYYPPVLNKKRAAEREDSMEGSQTKAVANNSKASSAYSSQTSITREIAQVKQPVVTSSRFSPSLLKLQEETGKIRKAKRSIKAINSYGKSSDSHPIPTVEMETVGKNNNLTNKHEKNNSKTSLSTNDSEPKFEGDTKLLKGKVVFTLDMDDLQRKEKKSLSFFRRKIFRKKRLAKTINAATQTEHAVKSQIAQISPSSIPSLLHSKHTQASCTVQSKSVQTQDVDFQNKQNLPSSDTTIAPHQTSGDSTFSNRPQVSLDDLVQSRIQKRAKSVINRKSQAEDEIPGHLQRSATVQARSKENSEGKRKSKAVKAYNWSQTDKFIKIVISHNGVHLIPINQIQVKSNGVNLKLLIEEKDYQQNSNCNENNNNDPGSTCHELFINRLCHPVVNLSYTIQPDMVAILLRKKAEKTWKQLQKPTDHFITIAPQVYL